jgi:23S rRNA pseudouridine2605 synthase
MAVTDARILRSGGKTAWLEIVLQEGKNRQIRRIIESLGMEVLRLIRIAIGGVVLGDLAKGRWRHLTAHELTRFVEPTAPPRMRQTDGRNAK